MAVGVGMVSIFSVMFLGLGSSITALPPGERDAAYLQCAPADALVYVEWATRGTGEVGGDGIDGLVADPEFATFVSDFKSAFLKMMEENAPPPVQHTLPLTWDLINRSGCLYVNYTPPDDGENPAEDPGLAKLALLEGLAVTLIVDGGDNAAESEQHLLALLSSIPGGPGGGFEKLDRYTIPLPLPDLEVVVHREGTYFIVALGKGTLDRALAGLKGEVEGLGQSDAYQESLKRVAMERIGTVSWFNLARIRDEGLKLAGPWGEIAGVMMTQLGVDRLNRCLSVSGIVDGQIASRTWLETGAGQKGLLTLFAGRSLSADDHQLFPKDCDFLTSFTVDAPLIRSTLKQLLKDVEPGLADNFDAIEAQLEDDLGFSIQDDLLEAFGQQITLFDSPAAGGLLLTSLTAAIEVKDGEKAEKIYGQLMAMLKEALPGDRSGGRFRRGVFLEEREFLDHTLYFVNTIGDDVPFAPTFCLTDRQMLVSPHPQAIKAHLRFLAEGGPTYAERFPDDLPEGAVISYGTFSAEKAVELIYAFVPYFGQVGLSDIQREGFELDIFSVPSAKAILPYMKESRGWVVRTENGLLLESRSSVPTSLFTLPMNFIIMAAPTRVFMNRPVPAEAIERF